MSAYAYEHTCTVCFRPVSEHRDDEVWPPRCCTGCGCGEEHPATSPSFAAPAEEPSRG
jgi:hypothetical protein